MSEGVYSAVPQSIKFTQVSLDICLSMGQVKRLALIPLLKRVGFPARFVKFTLFSAPSHDSSERLSLFPNICVDFD